MNARTPWAALVAAIAVVVAGCGSGTPEAPAPAATLGPDTPVVIYLIDTLRADRLGVYGYGKPTSPRLDALAKESIVFDAAYSAAPWTLPSVGALFTSRFACEHGLIKHNQRLSAKLPTLAERLQAAGHATGSYYMNAIVGPHTGLDRGFQVSERQDQEMRSLAPEAARFLDQAGGQPFLLYLHTMEPHNIEQVAPKYLKELGHVSVDDREAFTAHWDGLNVSIHIDRFAGTEVGETDSERDVTHAITSLNAMKPQIDRLYDASVRFADDNLGEVIDLLKSRGLWDRTLFIVIADHGESLGDHGTWFHEHTVYEELIRVPMIVKLPGGKSGGRRVGERVSLLDIQPTLLDLLGAGECAGCRGQSLRPLLEGARDNPVGWEPMPVPALRINRNSFYPPYEAARGDINVVVRDGPWKAIWNQERGRTELYELAADPLELADRGAAEAARAESMATTARDWLAACEAALVAPEDVPDEAIDAATRERLRALGYVR